MLEPSDYPRLAEAAFNGRDLRRARGTLGARRALPGLRGDPTRDAALARERALIAAFPDVRADLRRFAARKAGS